MRPRDFKRWRKSLGLSQKDAAEQLGLKRRVVQYYEKGERDGKDVDIPKSVRLACYALTEGVSDYHGPRENEPRASVVPLETTHGTELNGRAEANGQDSPPARAKLHKSGKGPSKPLDKSARRGAKKSRGASASEDA